MWANVAGGGKAAADKVATDKPAVQPAAQPAKPTHKKVTVDVNPTVAELKDVRLAANRLWGLDFNRLHPNVDYKVNLQHGKKPYHEGDLAPEKLFTGVSPAVFKRPTFATFYALLDNYERSTGKQETVTYHEKKENWAFLTEVMKTAPMVYAHRYLAHRKLSPSSVDGFKKQLNALWFGLYRRESNNDSSGFEHVFVGEERGGKVMGMHNWIQLYIEEQRGNLDYRGFIFPKHGGRKHDPYGEHQILTLQFAWLDELKPVSTSFIGVSPEFELALYTLMFLAGVENNKVQCGPYKLNIKCFRYGKQLGTSYPEEV